ncbi:Pycsar system effector family protein [Cellulosimicrobium funkei]
MFGRKESTQPPVSNDDLWRIHDAQMDWTGKVDAKAAFALTFQAALLAGVVALLGEMDTWLEYVLMGLSVVLVATGAVFATLVVAPRLRSKNLHREAASNYIYFGHARSWTQQRLVADIRRVDLAGQIARQVIVMAEIAWIKHRRAALSIWFGVAGGAFLLAAGVVSRLA